MLLDFRYFLIDIFRSRLFGNELCKKLAGVTVGKTSQKQVKDKNFINIERVILFLVDCNSDYLMDEEYVYRFIFTPPDIPADQYLIEDIITVEVKNQYGDNFSGSFKEFKDYCCLE